MPVTLIPEEDATPLVRLFTSHLRRIVREPVAQRLAESMNGAFVLISTSDHNAVTVALQQGQIRITGGRRQADVEIHTDLANLGSDRPTLKGAWKHPLFTLSVLRLLSASPGPWTDDVNRFWTDHRSVPGMPTGIRFIATDKQHEITVGSPVQFTIEAESAVIGSLTSGGSLLLAELLGGQLRIRGSMAHMACLANLTQELTMGHRQ